MADLSPTLVDEVVAACQRGATEVAAAFSRTFDAKITVAVGQPGTLNVQALPEGLAGPGLAIVLMVGSTGALLLLPESTGLVPTWCAEPDPTGESKLTTLAQELGMLLLPEQYAPQDFKAARLKHLAGALGRGGLPDGAPLVPLELVRDDQQRGSALLVWPAANPAAVIGAGVTKPKPKPQVEPKPKPAAAAKPAGGREQSLKRNRDVTPQDLPVYSRSLLRIRVPVVVTLARNRQPLGRIIELGPGSIIHFDKSCEEMLDLEVGGRAVASGEAVKVGDKFGLRITSVVLPEERFKPISPMQK